MAHKYRFNKAALIFNFPHKEIVKNDVYCKERLQFFKQDSFSDEFSNNERSSQTLPVNIF